MAWWWGYDIDKLPEDPHPRGHGLAADGAVRVLRRAGAAEDVAAGHEGGRLLRLETYGALVPVGRAIQSSGGFRVAQTDVSLVELCG